MARFEGEVGIQGYIEFAAGPSPTVAPTGMARLWWDQATSTFKMSVSGGAYAEMPSLLTDGIAAADLLTAIADGAFAADTATRALFGDGIWTQAKLDPASLDGTIAKVGANANVIGALEVLHRIDLAAGALGNTDVILTHKTRVIDAWLVLRGAGVASTTLQVFNGASAITNAMAASGADQALVRAATLDDAAWEIAAAGTLRVTSATGATQPDATVFVRGVRVA